MLQERGAIGSEEVVVVHGEGAAGEAGGVVGDVAAVVVLILKELGRTAVVAEGGVGGLDDAAGMFVHSVGVRAAGADGVAGVLHCRVVQDDAPLPLCVLGQAAVALHDDALPHLALAGVGQRAAIHDQLPAGTDDDVCLAAQPCRIVNIERGETVHNDFRSDATGEVRPLADGKG